MTNIETLLAVLLLANFAINLWLARELLKAKRRAKVSLMVNSILHDILYELRANSHRRDPKTGRLMKKGA